MEYPISVTFVVHATDRKDAELRLAQRLEAARLVRAPGPEEPGMIESFRLHSLDYLGLRARDRPYDHSVRNAQAALSQED